MRNLLEIALHDEIALYHHVWLQLIVTLRHIEWIKFDFSHFLSVQKIEILILFGLITFFVRRLVLDKIFFRLVRGFLFILVAGHDFGVRLLRISVILDRTVLLLSFLAGAQADNLLVLVWNLFPLLQHGANLR